MAEQTGAQTAAADKPRRSVINDAVGGVTYALEHRAGVARRMPLATSSGLAPAESEQADEITSTGETAAPAFAALGSRDTSRRGEGLRGTGPAASISDTKKETLGRSEVEGVMAEGTRLTRIVPVVWLYGTLVLAERRSGCVIILLGPLLGLAVPVLHMMGKGVGGEVAKSSGAFFFIRTIIAPGVTALFSVILSARGLWSLQRGQPR